MMTFPVMNVNTSGTDGSMWSFAEQKNMKIVQ